MRLSYPPLVDPQTITGPIKAGMATRAAQEARSSGSEAEAAAIILAAMEKASSMDRVTASAIRSMKIRAWSGVGNGNESSTTFMPSTPGD